MTDGYTVRQHSCPVRRYCRTLKLRSEELAGLYRERHAAVWPEITAGIREVGILEMEIYMIGTVAFMIIEAPADLDLDAAMARLATLPRQQEWEDFMSVFQDAAEGATSADKWQPMERVFRLPD